MRPYVGEIKSFIEQQAPGELLEVWLEQDCPEVRFTLPDMSLYHVVRRRLARVHEIMHEPFLDAGPLRVKAPEHLRRRPEDVLDAIPGEVLQ